jgi:hypothetical protein
VAGARGRREDQGLPVSHALTVGSMIAAFFHHGGRGTGPGRRSLAGVIREGARAEGRGWRRMNGGRFESWLRCPCCVRHAEHVMTTMRRRVASALAAVGLGALAGLCLAGGPVQAEPVAGQVVLIVSSVAAVGAFVALQVMARSRRRRPPVFADWRTWPPGYDPGAATSHDTRDRRTGRRRRLLDP